jgi:hypothetical protein
VKPLLKAVWRFLKKLKIELTYNPVIPLLVNYPKELMFIAALFTIDKLWKQSRCPTTDE